jgi:hypothetical protein
MFYHPMSALELATSSLPAIAGINLVPAVYVAPVVQGGCSIAKKKITFWRPRFLSLSDLLCWKMHAPRHTSTPPMAFLGLATLLERIMSQVSFCAHPDLVVTRFRSMLAQTVKIDEQKIQSATVEFAASKHIPDDVLRAVNMEASAQDLLTLERPRAIFSTTLTTADPIYRHFQILAQQKTH